MVNDAIELAKMSLALKSDVKSALEKEIGQNETFVRTIGIENAEEVIENTREGAVNICMLVNRPYNDVGAAIHCFMLRKIKHTLLTAYQERGKED